MNRGRSRGPEPVLSEISWNAGDNSDDNIAQIAVDGKADGLHFEGRFREIISDPINILIKRHPLAGFKVSGNVILHNGNRVPASGPLAYYSSFSSILVINRGVHEPLEEFAFQEVLACLPESPIMIELGAYWAHYSMWLKRVLPQAMVFMVEPDVSNLRVGRENFALNGFDGVFIQEFVGDGHFSVDNFLSDKRLGQINILHADIQGFEVEMLQGAAVSLSEHRIDYVFVSTHSQRLHGDVVAFLKVHGYRIELSADFENQTTSSDGLVLASAPEREPVLRDFRPLGRAEIVRAGPADLLASLMRSRYGVGTSQDHGVSPGDVM